MLTQSASTRSVFRNTLILSMVCLLVPTSRSTRAEEFKIETGFTAFFNGKDLSGWMLRGGDSLDGKTEAPKKRFQIEEKSIVIDGKTKGNMVIDTVAKFTGDVHLKFQYFPGTKCNNDLYFRGVKFDLKKGNVKNIEFDKWNDLEIIVEGDQVVIKNNRVTQRTAKAKSDSSPLGLRAEFGTVRFRRMRSKP